MMKNKAITSEVSTIRQMAVVKHYEKQTLSDSSRSENETLEHLYELEVHQIELELQIEALIQEKSITQDLSEKYKDAYEKNKDACQKYTELYDFAPSGYFTLSKAGEIMDVNINGAKKLGKARQDLKNSRLGFFVSNDTKQIFNLFLSTIFISKVQENCRVTLSTNNNIPLYIYMTGIADENREQCLVSMVDITGLRLEEQALINAKEQSEEQVRLTSAFLENMNHEIKTPMNGILGFTNLLKKPELSVEKQLMCISMIEKGCSHLLHIFNDQIDNSKIESGNVKVNITTCNVNEQIEYIYSFFKLKVEEKGIKLRFQNSLPTKVAVIQSDSEKIIAILTHLINNAIRNCENGSIVFGYVLKPAGAFLEMEFFVKDTGRGFPQNKMKTIFDSYIPIHDNKTNAVKGSGLGMSISKAYVEILGGKIWVVSEEGEGSTFYFTIPYNYKLGLKM